MLQRAQRKVVKTGFSEWEIPDELEGGNGVKLQTECSRQRIAKQPATGAREDCPIPPNLRRLVLEGERKWGRREGDEAEKSQLCE